MRPPITSIFEKLQITLLVMSSIRNQISHPSIFGTHFCFSHPCSCPIPSHSSQSQLPSTPFPSPLKTPPYLCPYPPPTSDTVFYAYIWSQLRTYLYFIISKVYAVTALYFFNTTSCCVAGSLLDVMNICFVSRSCKEEKVDTIITFPK